MATDINSILKAEQSVVNDDGDFTLTLWVTSATNPTIPEVIHKTWNIAGTPPADYVDDVLADNGYNPL